MAVVEQELVALPESLGSPLVISGVRDSPLVISGVRDSPWLLVGFVIPPVY